MPRTRRLALTPVAEVDPALLAWLAAELELGVPGVACALARPFAPRPDARLPDGGYPVDRCLDELVEWRTGANGDDGADWVLALADLDLRGPDGRPVFGQATLGGCCAVVGLPRLRPDMPVDRGEGLALLRNRLLKEALHEIGHLAGLPHCAARQCAMKRAADIVAVDAKPAAFCAACHAALLDGTAQRA